MISISILFVAFFATGDIHRLILENKTHPHTFPLTIIATTRRRD